MIFGLLLKAFSITGGLCTITTQKLMSFIPPIDNLFYGVKADTESEILKALEEGII
jgi:hypothetical protein